MARVRRHEAVDHSTILGYWKGRPSEPPLSSSSALTVVQDRILATCEENGLEYITDATNFQPYLTLRNALRHVIANKGDKSLVSL